MDTSKGGVYQIANNCRTSVQMIEQFYAAHIKDRIDTTAINVQRPKAARSAAKKPAKTSEILSTEGNAPAP